MNTKLSIIKIKILCFLGFHTWVYKGKVHNNFGIVGKFKCSKCPKEIRKGINDYPDSYQVQ